MDTGLGSKAYSIIEQGKIGLILSSKPADRRALIEEAAGITKYKARRRQTAAQARGRAAEPAPRERHRPRGREAAREPEAPGRARRGATARCARRCRASSASSSAGASWTCARRRESLTARIGAEGEREQAATIALESEEAQMEVRRTVALRGRGAPRRTSRTRLNELTLAVDRHQGRSGYCKEQIAETEARAAEARAGGGRAARRAWARWPSTWPRGARTRRAAARRAARPRRRRRAPPRPRVHEAAARAGARRRRSRRRRATRRSTVLGADGRAAERARVGVAATPSAPPPTC